MTIARQQACDTGIESLRWRPVGLSGENPSSVSSSKSSADEAGRHEGRVSSVLAVSWMLEDL